MPTTGLAGRLASSIVALGLVVGPVAAKPPGLPVPIEIWGPRQPQPATPPALDPVHQAGANRYTPEDVLRQAEAECLRAQADRCEAIRVFTRCLLFGINPASTLIPSRLYLTFSDDAYPVLSIAGRSVNFQQLVSGVALALSCGPFCPAGAAEETSGEEQEKAQMRSRFRELLLAGQLYSSMGCWKEARTCFLEVLTYCPEGALRAEAYSYLLHAPQVGDEQKPMGATEPQAVPVCPRAQKMADTKRKTPPSISEDSVLERLADVEEAARQYTRAEVLAHQGQFDSAVAVYEKVMQLVPGHRFAEMARERAAHLRDLIALPIDTPAEMKPGQAEDQSSTWGVNVVGVALAFGGIDVSELLHVYEVKWDRATDRLKVVKKHCPHRRGRELVSLILTGVAPESWKGQGGLGEVYFSAETKTLFIKATPEVHHKVHEILQAVHREDELRRQNCHRQVKASRKKKTEPRAASDILRASGGVVGGAASFVAQPALVLDDEEECELQLVPPVKPEGKSSLKFNGKLSLSGVTVEIHLNTGKIDIEVKPAKEESGCPCCKEAKEKK